MIRDKTIPLSTAVALALGLSLDVEADDLLVIQHAEYLGRAVPNRDSAQEFVTCDGDKIDPTAGTIRKVAQRCSSDDVIWVVLADGLVGTTVSDSQGNEIAEIARIARSEGTGEIHAVLDVGGFLGIGEKRVAFELDRFAVGPGQEVILPEVTSEELAAMPEYDALAYQELGGESG